MADVNSYPLERGDLHYAISKRVASSRFSSMTADDGLEDEIGGLAQHAEGRHDC